MSRRFFFLAVFVPLLLLVGLFILFTLSSAPRIYQGEGRVVGFGDDSLTVIIAHDAIEGLRPAMTMPFKARDVGEVAALNTGDAVRFNLEIVRQTTRIFGLKVIPRAAGHSASTPNATATGHVPVLQVGESLPDLPLVNQDHVPFNVLDFRGQAVVVTFIYTRCPLPDYCPLMSRNFKALHTLTSNRYGDNVQLVSISFDPTFDTPEVLQNYAQRYTSSTANWTFATGTPEQIARATTLFGVTVVQDGNTIDHNLSTTLIGPDGHVVAIWRGNEWKPEDVLAALDNTLRSPQPEPPPNPAD